MDDGISYNSTHICMEELIVENHIQALARQICGYTSPYEVSLKIRIICDTIMGISECDLNLPNYLNLYSFRKVCFN